MNTRIRALLAAGLCAALGEATALEIDPLVVPEINIGGRGIATVKGSDSSGPEGDSASEVDTADSSLLLGFSKYLFSDRDYGFGAIGFKTVESGSDLDDDMFIHQAFVGIGGPRYEITLGRTRLPNTLLSFPTLRDDDLLEFTHVGNGLVDAHAEEYVVYGNQAGAQWWFSPFVRLGVTATARAEGATADAARIGDFNGGALVLAYDVPETIKFARGVRYAALGVDYQDLDALGTAPADDLTALLAGLSLNLSNNPEATWNLDLQAIRTSGAKVDALGEAYERARARSTRVVAALRYAARPYLQTRWQAALTIGWKDYSEFDAASSWVVAPSYVHRLGSGVDLIAQLKHQTHDDGLTAATRIKDEQAVWLGLSVAFDYTLNESVATRGSILGLEHSMTGVGPVVGGH